MLAVVRPGEGLVEYYIYFNWNTDREAAMLAVVDPNGLSVACQWQWQGGIRRASI